MSICPSNPIPAEDKNPSNFSDSDDEEITQEYLQSLLDKAKSNARESANLKKALRDNVFGAGEDIVKLDGDDSERYCMNMLFNHFTEFCYRPLPPLDPGELPPAYFDFDKDRRNAPATVREPTETATSGTVAPAPPPNPMATGKILTKKQRKAVGLRV